MRTLLISICLIFTNFSLTQPKQNSFNASLGYNRISVFEKPGGIRVGIAYQRTWLKLAFNWHYNKILHYDNVSAWDRRLMQDKFYRFGSSIDFRLFRINKHELFLGHHVNRFYRFDHQYYYENPSANILSEINCSGDDCPWISGNSSFDFERRYRWQLGVQMEYNYNVWNQLYLGLIVEFSMMWSTGRYSHTGTYYKFKHLGLSPSVNLTYKLPFGKEIRKKYNND